MKPMMTSEPPPQLVHLMTRLIGRDRTARVMRAMWTDPALLDDHRAGPPAPESGTPGDSAAPLPVPRAVMAQAINLLLFEDLLQRVPDAHAYVQECLEQGHPVLLDHGALRTVALQGLAIPPGHQAFARLLEPLGYRHAGTYPLDSLRMCGFVYCHVDYPETISQFFVSELYPERFSPPFQEAVQRVLASTRDPLSERDRGHLATLAETGHLPLEHAVELLPALVACFDRQHQPPTLADYEILKSESREMAWIATEGNAFNHATDRVADLDALDAEQRQRGRPMKPAIEEGQNARIRQTAYRAATVERPFRVGNAIALHPVPGSFFEFIQRGTVLHPETGAPMLDLRFDSRNAQGIFTMTRA